MMTGCRQKYMTRLIYAYGLKKRSGGRKVRMAELLNKEFITIHAAPCSWKEAIRRSAKPLEQFGYIEPRYTQEAIEK